MTDSVSNSGATQPLDEALPAEADAVTEVRADAVVEGDALPAVTGLEPDEAASVEAPPEEEGSPATEAEVALAALQGEFDVLNDRYLRLAAEFTNYRRRVEQERTDLWGRAQGEILGKLLDVLDDLQRVAALDLENATVEAILEGIDLVDRKFERILADTGVEVVDPVGVPFDPETMEAMMRVPTEAEEEDDRVAQVFQKGYTLKGQLLRPARVSVLKTG